MNTLWLKLGETDAAPTESSPPHSQTVDDARGPSNPPPRYTSQSREGINPEKQAACTPQNNKGKGVDQGGNDQPPPPPPHNPRGDLDPDDDDSNDGDDDRGRKAGRPARAPRQSSMPREMSPKTQAIVTYLERLGTSTR